MANDVTIEFWFKQDRGWFWHVKALNGFVLADSGEGYYKRRDCIKGAAQVLGVNASWFWNNGMLWCGVPKVEALDDGPWKPGATREFIVRR